MIKRLALLRRRADLEVEAFRRYWAGPHGDLAKAMPRLAGYKQNVTTAVLLTPPEQQAPFQVDGLAELWFASADEMAEAFASPAGRALPADEAKFLGGITILAVNETTLRPGKGAAKLFLLIADRQSGAALGLAQAIRAALAAGEFAEILACVENLIDAVAVNPDLWREASPPTAAYVLEFASAATARVCVASTPWRDLLAMSGRHCKTGAFLVAETTLI